MSSTTWNRTARYATILRKGTPHGSRVLSAENRTHRVLFRQFAARQSDHMGRGNEPRCCQEPARNGSRNASDYLRDWRSQERGRNRIGRLGRCCRSEETVGEDQGRKGARTARLAG